MAIAEQQKSNLDPSGQETLERVSEFVLTLRPEDVPESALDAASVLLLDTLGVTAAATSMEAGRILRDCAVQLYGAGPGAPQASLLFDGRKASPAGAAYAAAGQTDNLDAHDGYNPTKGHIGVAVVPALLALGESGRALSGREALTALVVAYEVAGRAGMSLHDTVTDYHTSGAWNCLGVAAMGARLRGLTPDQLRQALGFAEYHGPRSQMMREIAHPTMLHDGSATGALVGLSAVVHAAHGFTGAPAITVEADEVTHHWADLGHNWIVEQQYIKPYPICRWAHAAIDGVLQLRQAHGLTADDVVALRINTFTESAQLFAGIPSTTSLAQYSLPFAVATALSHGRIGLEHISGAGLKDLEVARLVAATQVFEDERHSARFPAGRWADVVIELKDGRVLRSGDVQARGAPETALSREEIMDKFQEYAAPVLGTERSARLQQAITGLVEEKASLASVIEASIAPLN
ncbi:MAG: MmgE/PrpD family protein [Pseudomonadota bacterium]